MIVELDASSAVPPYEQVRVQIAAQVTTGGLAPGARLPSIRQLANDLQVATGTIARAYRELEAAGVVETRGRHGTSVVGPASATGSSGDAVLASARHLVAQAFSSGLSLDETLSIVRLAATEEGN